MDLQITPNLNWPYIEDMFDAGENDLLIEIDTGDLVDLGSTAPSTYNAVYKSTASRVFLLDIGAGDKYYEVPIVNFDLMTWGSGGYLYRLSTPTPLQRFVLLLNG